MTHIGLVDTLTGIIGVLVEVGTEGAFLHIVDDGGLFAVGFGNGHTLVGLVGGENRTAHSTGQIVGGFKYIFGRGDSLSCFTDDEVESSSGGVGVIGEHQSSSGVFETFETVGSIVSGAKWGGIFNTFLEIGRPSGSIRTTDTLR